MVTHEGGTIPEENLTNYNVDRVKTLGEAVLGLTLGCAQCHDHKYDPITQRDYYQLFAYFNTLSDMGLDGNGGVNPRPVYEAKTVLQTGEEPELRRANRAAAKDNLPTPTAADVARWEAAAARRSCARAARTSSCTRWKCSRSARPTAARVSTSTLRNFVHITVPTGMVAYDVSMRLPKLDKPITGVRVVFHPDAAAAGGGRGYGTLDSHEPMRHRRTRHVRAHLLLRQRRKRPRRPGESQPAPRRASRHGQLLAAKLPPGKRPRHPQRKRLVARADHDGPAHITVTFDEPLDAASTPF